MHAVFEPDLVSSLTEFISQSFAAAHYVHQACGLKMFHFANEATEQLSCQQMSQGSLHQRPLSCTGHAVLGWASLEVIVTWLSCAQRSLANLALSVRVFFRSAPMQRQNKQNTQTDGLSRRVLRWILLAFVAFGVILSSLTEPCSIYLLVLLPGTSATPTLSTAITAITATTADCKYCYEYCWGCCYCYYTPMPL